MKITVEIADADLKDICRLTGERKRGPAVRKLVLDALQLKRRAQVAQKFLDGEWGVELQKFEETQEADRAADRQDERRWRE